MQLIEMTNEQHATLTRLEVWCHVSWQMVQGKVKCRCTEKFTDKPWKFTTYIMPEGNLVGSHNN